jgi:hypothetical protein
MIYSITTHEEVMSTLGHKMNNGVKKGLHDNENIRLTLGENICE